MAVDQRATFQPPDPFPPELMRMLATASREVPVRMYGRLVLAEHTLAVLWAAPVPAGLAMRPPPLPVPPSTANLKMHSA